MSELMDAADINRTLDRISHQIIEKTADADRVVLLGIPSGGVPLAKRLATKIEQYGGKTIPSGSLDTTLYRDDLRGRPHRALQPTSIPDEGIDGATVVLVDDVLYSGRTIRAALEAVADSAGVRFLAPPLVLCTDNAAMIAWAGIERFRLGHRDGMELSARPRWPLDGRAAPMLGAGKRGAKA